MSDSSDPDSESYQGLVPTERAETILDAHGYDPARYEWLPVLRKPRPCSCATALLSCEGNAAVMRRTVTFVTLRTGDGPVSVRHDLR